MRFVTFREWLDIREMTSTSSVAGFKRIAIGGGNPVRRSWPDKVNPKDMASFPPHWGNTYFKPLK